jgi:hypothetical protein
MAGCSIDSFSPDRVQQKLGISGKEFGIVVNVLRDHGVRARRRLNPAANSLMMDAAGSLFFTKPTL